jgi:hypothetical protein
MKITFLIFIFQIQLILGQEIVCPKQIKNFNIVDTTGTIEFENKKGLLQIPTSNYTKLDTSDITPIYNCGLGSSDKQYNLIVTCKPNTSVFSVAKGKVTSVSKLDSTWIVIVRHGLYLSVYCCLDTVNVKENQIVSDREQLGQLTTIDNVSFLEFQLWKNKNRVIVKDWLLETTNRNKK